MLILNFKLKTSTKTCYRFETKGEDGQFMTLYLKRDRVDKAGINALNGIKVTVEGAAAEVSK